MPTIEISEEALAYLKSNAEPLTDTTVTVMDRLINTLKTTTASHSDVGQQENEFVFSSSKLPSVAFTSVLSAKVLGQASNKYWNNILEDVVAACISKGATTDHIIREMSARTVIGNKTENGYRPVPSAGMSFQGLDADRSLKQIHILSEKFSIPVEITWRWQANEKAVHPDAMGRISLP